MSLKLRPAIFIDKDGTLVENAAYNVDPARIRILPGAREGLALLAALGYPLVVVSNQPGLARGLYSQRQLLAATLHLHARLAESGLRISAFYYCPHHPDGSVRRFSGACGCRKPKPGLILNAARERGIDLARSWMIGDILDDVEAGKRAGCRAVLIDNGHETEWKRSPERTPDASAPDVLAAARWIAARPSLAAGIR